MQNGTIFEKSQNIFLKRGGVMAYLSDDELLDTEGGFTGWDDGTGAGARRKRWNRRLRKNVWPSWKASWSRTSIPLTMMPNWRTEEEEAAPVSDKRLKREMRAEAIRRLEEAARTEKDFRVVVGGMEQAGPEPGAPGAGPRKPPWRCAAGISGSAGTETHSPLDEQPRIPAADGRELSGHPV